jgi:hypothetical protein
MKSYPTSNHNTSRASSLNSIAVASFIMVMTAKPAVAGYIFVTAATDGTTTGCNLRNAILASNAGQNNVGGCFGADTGKNTIDLSNVSVSVVNAGKFGSMTITRAASIRGGGTRVTAIASDPADSLVTPVFIVATGDGGGVDFAGLTIRNFKGHVVTINSGALAGLADMRFLDNKGSLSEFGGCVLNQGTINIYDTEFDGCEGTSGAGLRNDAPNALAFIEGTTFVRGSAERGGAIYNNGTVGVTNSTIATNSVTVYGAAIQNLGTASIFGSTIAYNVVGSGPLSSCRNGNQICAAIQNAGSGTLTIGSSVVANNTSPTSQLHPNCLGIVTSYGFNLLGETATKACSVTLDPSASGADLAAQDPVLNPAAGNLPGNFGGIGKVFLPGASSPLLDKIPHDTCGYGDQRGISRRIAGSNCDVGAVERAPALLVVGNTTLSAGDQKVNSALTRIGFSPTIQSGSATSAASANGKTVVVISESVNPTTVNTKFLAVAQGLAVLEPFLFDDLKMTGLTSGTDYGTTNTTGLTFNSGCDMTLKIGYSGFITTVSPAAAHGWGVPGVGAQLCGSVGSNKWGLFEYVKRSSLKDNSIAAGNRIGFFATEAAAAALTADGISALEGAIIAAAQETETPN